MLQTITFADAGDYTLTYLDGTRHANNGDVNYVVTLRSNVDNALAFSVNKTALLGQAFTANTFLMTVPTAGNYTLRFFVQSTGFDSDNSGVFDNISVVSAVPEPSTYAAVFGALSLGFVIWTKRKKGTKRK